MASPSLAPDPGGRNPVVYVLLFVMILIAMLQQILLERQFGDVAKALADHERRLQRLELAIPPTE
jgi:hypothetical protein